MNARIDPQAMSPVNLQHYWMPFTDNRRFKARPRLIASAKDMYFTTVEGNQVLDGLATLWCVNAWSGGGGGGGRRPRGCGGARGRVVFFFFFFFFFFFVHPLPFRLAERIAA